MANVATLLKELSFDGLNNRRGQSLSSSRTASRRRKHANAQHQAIVEALEPRILFAANIYGNSTAKLGYDYTLTLNPDGQNVSQWAVNWQDGTVDTLAGTTTSVTHRFGNVYGGIQVSAVATVNGQTQSTNAQTITISGEPEQLYIAPGEQNILARTGIGITQPSPGAPFIDQWFWVGNSQENASVHNPLSTVEVADGWISNAVRSRWIEYPGAVSGTSSTYTWTTHFVLSDFFPSSADISYHVATPQHLTSVLLNDVEIWNATSGQSTAYQFLNIPISPSSPYVSGDNVLKFITDYSSSNVPLAINIYAQGTAVRRIVSDGTNSIHAPPHVVITSPAPSSVTTRGQTVTLTATVTSPGEPGASMSEVRFRTNDGTSNGQTLIATINPNNTTQYLATWTPISTGHFTITAVATNGYGMKDSDSVDVSVFGFNQFPASTFHVDPAWLSTPTVNPVWGPGDFFLPKGFNAIQEINASGQLVRTLPLAGSLNQSVGDATYNTMAFDGHGNLYVALGYPSLGIQVFGPNAVSKGVITMPFGITKFVVDDAGNICGYGEGELVRRAVDGNISTIWLAHGSGLNAIDLDQDQHTLWMSITDTASGNQYIATLDLNTMNADSQHPERNNGAPLWQFDLTGYYENHPPTTIRALKDSLIVSTVSAVGWDSHVPIYQYSKTPAGTASTAVLVAVLSDSSPDRAVYVWNGPPVISADEKILWVPRTFAISNDPSHVNADGLGEELVPFVLATSTDLTFASYPLQRGPISLGRWLPQYLVSPARDPEAFAGMLLYGGYSTATASPAPQPYRSSARADGLSGTGSHLTYTLATDAEQASIDPVTGDITWMPRKLGLQTFTVTVTDGNTEGNERTDRWDFTVNVIAEPTNTAPIISTTTLSDGNVNRQYINKIFTNRTTGDFVTFSLLSKPEGMTIDSRTGTLAWMPDDTFLSNHNNQASVTVKAQDAYGHNSTHSYAIHFQTIDIDTLILPFKNIHIVNSGLVPGYANKYGFSLINPPTGTSSTYSVTWSFSAPESTESGFDTGSDPLNKVLTINDYAGPVFVTATLHITVPTPDPGNPNATINIQYLIDRVASLTIDRTLTSLSIIPPPRSADSNGLVHIVQGSLDQFSVRANDQFGHEMDLPEPVSWSVTGAGHIDDSGLYSAPSSSLPTDVIHVAYGTVSSQLTISIVAPGVIPIIHFDTPPLFKDIGGYATDFRSVTLTASADDDGPLENLTYTWNSTSPNASNITFVNFDGTSNATAGTGAQVHAIFSHSGHYTFNVTVRDPQGNASYDDSLFVDVPVQLAAVQIIPQDVSGGKRRFRAFGLDNFGDQWPLANLNFQWSGLVNGSTDSVELDDTASGRINVRVSAQDQGLNPDVVDAFYDIHVPTANAPIVPVAAIWAPSKGYPVKGLVDITGIAGRDGSTSSSFTYLLSIAPAAQPTAFMPLNGTGNSATVTVTGTLGSLDATAFANGDYILRLVVNANGQTTTCDSIVSIVGEQKVGNFIFSEADLSIPLGSGTFAITRTYDSSNRFSSGLFGYGWASSIDLNFQQSPETRNAATVYQYAEGDYGYFLQSGNIPADIIRTGGSRDVFVTLPSGRRVKFLFQIQNSDVTKDSEYVGAFVCADPSVKATLRIDSENFIDADCIDKSATYGSSTTFYTWRKLGPNTLLDTSFNWFDAYDIPGYILTEDGVKYYIAKTESDFTAGKGRAREFKYGDDVDFTQRSVSINHTYLNDPHLTKIVDASGNTILFSKNADGDPLLTLLPADGSSPRYVKYHITNNRIDHLYDLGNDSTSAGTLVSSYAYTSNDLTSITRYTTSGNAAEWLETEYAYASASDPVKAHAMTQLFAPHAALATGATPKLLITNTYSDQTGRLISTKDEVNNQTVTYAAASNATHKESVIDQRGVTTDYSYDEDGNVFLVHNLTTGEQTYAVYTPGTHNKISETSAFGTPQAFTRNFEYDDYGAQTKETYDIIIDGTKHRITTTSTYKNIGDTNNPIHVLNQSTDALGNVTTNIYDENTTSSTFTKLLWVEVATSGGTLLQKTEYAAYSGDNPTDIWTWNKPENGDWARYFLTKNIYTDGFLTQTEIRDNSTNHTLLQLTTYTPDDRRLNVASTTQWNTTPPSGTTPTSQTFDGRTWYASTSSTLYDLLNRTLESTDPAGRHTYTFYADNGQVLGTVNSLGVGTLYLYTDLGQQQSVVTGLLPTGTASSLAGAALIATVTNAANATAKDNARKEVAAALNALATSTNTDITRTFTRYNAAGQQTISFDPLEYNARINSGHSITDSTYDPGYGTEYLYDAAGRLLQTKYVGGGGGTTSETLYDPAGRPWIVTDRHLAGDFADATRTTYDPLGRVIATERLSGIKFHLTHAASPVDAWYIDDLDYKVSNATHSISTLVSNLAQTYATLTTALTTTPLEVLSISTTHYNPLGQVDYTTAPHAPSATSIATTSYIYDDFGRQSQVTQPAITVIDPNNGSTSSVTPVTTYHYDGLGRRTSVEAPATWTVTSTGTLQTGQVRQTTSYTYDELGQVTKVTFHDGSFKLTSFDALGRKTSETTQLAVRGASENDTDFAARIAGGTTDYSYDVSGNLVAMTLPAVAIATPSNPSSLTYTMPTGNKVRPRYEYYYDVNGRQTDAVTNIFVDGNGRFVYLKKDSDTASPTFGKDVIKSVRTAYSSTPPSSSEATVTHYTYDAFSRELSRTLPLGQQESTTYDTYGRQKTTTSFEGKVTFFGYDDTAAAGGRLAAKVLFADATAYGNWLADVTSNPNSPPAHKPGEAISFFYDDLGRPDHVIQNAWTGNTLTLTHTWQFHYDAHGHQDSVSCYPAVSTLQSVVHHEYDPATGQLTETWSTFGTGSNRVTDTMYFYDALGRLQAASIPNATHDGFTYQTHYWYDPAGNLDGIDQPNGLFSDYSYDAMGHLIQLRHFKDVNHNHLLDNNTNETFLAGFLYAYNPDGNKKQEKDYIGGTANPVGTFKWTYDALGRLIKESNAGDILTGGSATGSIASPYADFYSFDLVGNRVMKDHQDMAADNDDQTDYLTDANDRVRRETTTRYVLAQDEETLAYFRDTSVAGIPRGSVQYLWGNDTNQSSTMLTTLVNLNPTGGTLGLTNFTYSLSNQLTTIDERNSSNTTTRLTSLAYAFDGTRIQQSVSVNGGTAVTTDFTIDTDNPTGYAQTLFESQGTNVKTTYLIGQQVVALTDPNILVGTVQGDANNDGAVDSNDLTIIAAHWNQQSGATWADGDFNGDGKVDSLDLTILAGHWQSSILTVLLYDGHGNVRLDSGPTAGTGDRFTYDAYGNLLPGTGLASSLDNAKTRLGYNGTYTLPNGMQLYGTEHGRLYDSSFGGWTQQDSYRPGVFNSWDRDLYGYVHGNPVNCWDATGTVTLFMGTEVHQYLCRDQFELTAGAHPGSLRWGNRWVSTIIRDLTGSATLNPLRPDMVEVAAGFGDVYELKPGAISLITNRTNFFNTAVNSINQALSYMALLSAVPSITWDMGDALWPGVEVWNFFDTAGEQLVTFNMYSVAPGIIFYDFLPTKKTEKIAGLTLAAAAAVVASWYAAPVLGGAVMTAGGLVVAEVEAMIALVSMRMVATRSPI